MDNIGNFVFESSSLEERKTNVFVDIGKFVSEQEDKDYIPVIESECDEMLKYFNDIFKHFNLTKEDIVYEKTKKFLEFLENEDIEEIRKLFGKHILLCLYEGKCTTTTIMFDRDENGKLRGSILDFF